jgi:hypothetical protein
VQGGRGDGGTAWLATGSKASRCSRTGTHDVEVEKRCGVARWSIGGVRESGATVAIVTASR